MCDVKRLLPVVLLAAFASVSSAAAASDALVGEINAIRTQGCAGRPRQPALRRDAALDRAAAALSSGTPMKSAMASSGYRATRTALLELTGASEAAMAKALAQRGCRDIANPAYRDVGLATRADAAWIVLAAPLAAPAAADSAAIGARVLALVNEARAIPRRCGWRRLAAAPPLATSAALDRAALAHAKDMAARNALSHAGGDGSTPAVRATRAGYRWRLVGENIAAGQPTPEQVVADWLESPRHCANLMDPAYVEMGIGYTNDPASVAGIYWSQLFGAPAS